jgi:hypothetical protein
LLDDVDTLLLYDILIFESTPTPIEGRIIVYVDEANLDIVASRCTS